MSTKGKILTALQESRGSPVSGERLAQELGVSRCAVWKGIEALRCDGHMINAAPRRGYTLERTSDILTEDGIRAQLAKIPDGELVSRVICLDTVDSTNDFAKREVLAGNAGFASGTLVTANQQTAGRGRRGHSFTSPPGTGLYMTLILRPTAELGRFQMVTAAAAVAVCLTLEELAGARPLIKWVNDVFLRHADGTERKICGILSEAVTSVESGEIESVIVGIGLNVTDNKNFPPELMRTAGSLFGSEEALSVSRDMIAAGIAARLTKMSGHLDDPRLIEDYRRRSMLTGREITYSQNGTSARGRVAGVDDFCSLIVEDVDGKRHVLRSGEVFEVRTKEGSDKI